MPAEILLLDDSLYGIFLKDKFTKSGHNVHHSLDVDEALEHVSSRTDLDAVYFQYSTTGIMGVRFAYGLRVMPHLERVRIVAMIVPGFRRSYAEHALYGLPITIQTLPNYLHRDREVVDKLMALGIPDYNGPYPYSDLAPSS